MKISTLRICAVLALAFFAPLTLSANDLGVTKLQQSFTNQIVTVRIGQFAETHDITIATYQTLLRQGVPATLVDMPQPEQDQLRQLMIKSAGWSVGVFR